MRDVRSRGGGCVRHWGGWLARRCWGEPVSGLGFWAPLCAGQSPQGALVSARECVMYAAEAGVVQEALVVDGSGAQIVEGREGSAS